LVKGRLGVDNEGEQLLGEGVHCRIVQTVRKVYEGLPFADGHQSLDTEGYERGMDCHIKLIGYLFKPFQGFA
jgi:hypothetical protein